MCSPLIMLVSDSIMLKMHFVAQDLFWVEELLLTLAPSQKCNRI